MPETVKDYGSYVGPRPFGYSDSNVFFGREREIDEIVSLVVASRLLVVYAASGAGKTSLMNAGVIPALSNEGFEVLPALRFRRGPADLPKVKNFYVFNALMSLAENEGEIDPRTLAQVTLAEFLRKKDVSSDNTDEPTPRVLIFDQFEELFTIFTPHWQERREFFKQLDEALSNDRHLRAIFVLREEHVAGLDPYALLFTDQLRSRVRIEKLKRDAALRAITGPLALTDRHFEEGVAEHIVDNLLTVNIREPFGEKRRVIGEYVEPVQLQVVCQSLWSSLEAGRSVITMEDVEAVGDVDTALSVFYERSIQQVISATLVKEGALRQWFERALITPVGTRATVYRGKEETGRLPNAAIDLLDSLHIVRAEVRAGIRWYELSHDRFVTTIQESNRRWLSQFSDLERRRTQLEEKALAWTQDQRSFLSESELIEAENLVKELTSLGLDFSPLGSAFISASRRFMDTSPGNKQRWLIYGLIATTVASMILAAVAWSR